MTESFLSRHKFSVCQTPELLGLFPLSTTQRSDCLRPLWPHCSCPDWPEYSHDFEQSWLNMVFTSLTLLRRYSQSTTALRRGWPPEYWAWPFDIFQSPNQIVSMSLNHLGFGGRLVDDVSCGLNHRRRTCLEGWDTVLMLVQLVSPILSPLSLWRTAWVRGIVCWLVAIVVRARHLATHNIQQILLHHENGRTCSGSV